MEGWHFLGLLERSREGFPRQEWGEKGSRRGKRTKNGKEWFWFNDKKPEPQQEQREEKESDWSATEEVSIVEVRPEETQVERMMWLA